jgi:erythromycin esterase
VVNVEKVHLRVSRKRDLEPFYRSLRSSVSIELFNFQNQLLPIMRRLLAVLIATLCMPLLSNAQGIMNLGVETIGSSGSPDAWYLSDRMQGLDSLVKHSGKYSLRLIAYGKTAIGVGHSFETRTPIGKSIQLAGWIKCENLSGFAGLWMRVDGPNRSMLAFNNMHDSAVAGNRDWSHFAFSLPVDSSAVDIAFGTIVAGTGRAWFDDLEMTVDGTPIEHIVYGLNHAHDFELTTGQLDLLKRSVIPIKSAEPTSDLDDLEPLRSVIGNAELVGLGEATHGTSEFSKMKHKMFEFLATKMGFTIFSIEASMPDAYQINDYVLNGAGDPTKLIEGMGFWTWDTKEMLDLVEWMRVYNHSHTPKLQFTGFDMQSVTRPIQVVEHLILKAEPSYLGTLSGIYGTIGDLYQRRMMNSQSGESVNFGAASEGASDILNHLKSNRDGYLKAITIDSVEWLIQNARIVTQFVKLMGSRWISTIRDSCMAWNIGWIRDRNPGAKLVLWAHNFHIRNADKSMGSYLDQRFQKAYRRFGFAFDSGTYTAVAGQDFFPSTQTAPAADQGSFEYNMHRLGMPILCLNFSGLPTNEPITIALSNPVRFREMGAVASNDYEVNNLSKSFDAIFYFDNSTHSELLKPKK